MRYFRLEPGGGSTDDGDTPIGDALGDISERLVELGARKAVLIVEDDDGVSIAIGRAPGLDDAPKDTADMLLRVALDAKDLVE